MKVTAVETLQLAEFPFLFWLRVHTDAGIIGTGETFWAPGPVASYIHDNVAPYLLGKDPRDIELHDRTLGSVYVGARDSGAEVRGNSAVNIALWDIYGQALGEPLWRLLGGRTHQSVPIYNTCAGYKHVRATKKNALFERGEDWSLKPGDSNEGPYEDLLAWRYNAGELAKGLLSEGIRAMKIWPFDVAAEASNGTRISLPDLDKALEPFGKNPRFSRPRHGDHGRTARTLDLAAGHAHSRRAERLRRCLAGGTDPLQRTRRHGGIGASYVDPDRGKREAGVASDVQASDRQARSRGDHDRSRLVWRAFGSAQDRQIWRRQVNCR